jgi:predicted nucleic acid-binding Zn finger protein
MAPQWAAQWNVNSHSDPSKVYVVSVAKTGRWACSCPAHRFAKNGPDGNKPDCKHIRGVKKVEVTTVAVSGTFKSNTTVVVVNTPQQVVLQTRREICLDEE